jgi:hypothetical protein
MAKKSRFTGFKKKASSIVDSMKKTTSSGEGGYKSEFWRPGLEQDQDSAEYIVRFLPNNNEEADDDVHFVSRPTHMIKFQSSGNFISEPCPKRNGKAEMCPICEVVNPLFKGSEAEKKVALDQYAKARFFSNVYVLKDPRNDGENEGKIMMYEYGKTIYELCLKSMEIDEDDDEKTEDDIVIYYDPLEGADFKIIIKRVAGYPNYDDSKFIRSGKPLRLVDGSEIDEDNIDAFMDGELVEGMGGAFNLQEKLLNDDLFKSYPDLKKIYENQGYPKKDQEGTSEVDDEDEDDEEEVVKKFETSKKNVQKRNNKEVETEKEVDDEDYEMDDEDDDDLADEEYAELFDDDED